MLTVDYVVKYLLIQARLGDWLSSISAAVHDCGNLYHIFCPAVHLWYRCVHVSTTIVVIMHMCKDMSVHCSYYDKTRILKHLQYTYTVAWYITFRDLFLVCAE